MRVRIVRDVAWQTDGMLSRFNVGDTYDMPEGMAMQLIHAGSAIALEPAPPEDELAAENRALVEELRNARAARSPRPKVKRND